MKSFLILILALLAFSPASGQSIKVNMTLRISIQGVPVSEQSRLNADYPVASNGTITMWELGSVSAAGLSNQQLAQKIASEYKRRGIYSNPNFQVIMPSEQGRVQNTFTVGGAVRGAGQKQFTDGMTLFGAIQSAGGETEFGAVTRIRLYRNGEMKLLNLKNNTDKNFRIRPDDMLEVPQKNWIGQ